MLFGLAALSLAIPVSFSVHRGQTLREGPSYVSVTDTTLDSELPDHPQGGNYTLTGGPGKTILIRFGDLRRVIGAKYRITQAELVLTPSSDAVARLGSAGAMLKPWGEGPALTFADVHPFGKVDPTKYKPPYGAATWRTAEEGVSGLSWQSPGANGAGDAEPIALAASQMVNGKMIISGLGSACAAMADGKNFGLALKFESPVEFVSSEAAEGQPELKITAEPIDDTPAPDLAVTEIVKNEGGGAWRAHVKNVGNAAAPEFRVHWISNGIPGADVIEKKQLAPGEEAIYDYQGEPRGNDRDHRQATLGLAIVPKTPDAAGANDSLTIFTQGIPVYLRAEQPGASVDSSRGTGLENWAQAQIEAINELYFARSRYSATPDGGLERVRLAGIISGTAKPTVPDAAMVIDVMAGETNTDALSVPLIKRVLLAVGVPDLSAANMAFPSGVPGGLPLSASWFPDVTGGGETRFDGQSPPTSSPLSVPVDYSADGVALTPPALGLISSSGISAMNAAIGLSGAARKQALQSSLRSFPGTTLMRCLYANGAPLRNVTLSVFQSKDGQLPSTPTFTIPSGSNGLVVLSSRLVPGTQTRNPFASDHLPEDGTMAVQATIHGVTSTAWLYSWQLHEAQLRGLNAVAFQDLYFDLPLAPIDAGTNYALNRVVRDSAGSFPVALAPIVDGVGDKGVQLPTKPGDWVEIDLNRDRTLTELRLSTLGGDFWKRFDIVVYGTGQQAGDGQIWASEKDWNWTRVNRSVSHGKIVTVTYFGPLIIGRYIRIIARQAGTAELSQVEVYSSASSD